MAGLRDNFSAKVKRVLASRVAFRCSFPDCGVLTIGPKAIADNEFVNIGEAAHIHGAAPGGPRYNPIMTSEERSSIANGIWMCRHHARLIDADEGSYSAETIMQWKLKAETETYRQLKDLTKLALPEPTTLISLTPKLIFEGIWAGAEDDTWRFIVKHFIYGDLNTLRAYRTGRVPGRKDYIIVESQGDGRLIQGDFHWVQHNDALEISANVFPSAVRRNPNFIGKSPAWGGNDILENGRWRMVEGKELAIQKIGILLNTPQGSRFMNGGYGTLLNVYFDGNRNNYPLLNRLVKLELTRLISIPTNPEKPNGDPELNFINRINEVHILGEENGTVDLRLALEWGDGTLWDGEFKVHIGNQIDANASEALPPVKFVPEQESRDPKEALKTLTASLSGDELQMKVNEASILEMFKETLPAIMERADQSLNAEVFPLFNEHKLLRTFDNNTFEYLTSYDLEKHLHQRGLIHDMGVIIKLEGFKKAGVKAFDITSDLVFHFNDYNYTIGPFRSKPWLTKLYGTLLTDIELEQVTNNFIEHIIHLINNQIIAVKQSEINS